MSVERMAARAVWGAAAAHIVAHALAGIGEVANAIETTVDRCADGIFYIETHYAMRYKNLTGTDLGCAIGHSDRFVGAAPGFEPEEES